MTSSKLLFFYVKLLINNMHTSLQISSSWELLNPFFVILLILLDNIELGLQSAFSNELISSSNFFPIVRVFFFKHLQADVLKLIFKTAKSNQLFGLLLLDLFEWFVVLFGYFRLA